MRKFTLLLVTVGLLVSMAPADDIVIWRDDMAAEGRQYWGGATLVGQGPGYRTVDMTGTGSNSAFVTGCNVNVKAGDVVRTTYLSSYKDFTTGMLYYRNGEYVIMPTKDYTTTGPHTDEYAFQQDSSLTMIVARNWVNWRPYVNLTFQGHTITRSNSQYVWHNDMTNLSNVRAFGGTTALDANGFVELTCTNNSSGIALHEGSSFDVKAGAELRINFNVVDLPPDDNSFQDVFVQIGGVATFGNRVVADYNQYAMVYEFTEDATVDYIYFRPMWGNGGKVRITDAMIIETVPEPTTMALLMLGGAAAVIRRKKK